MLFARVSIEQVQLIKQCLEEFGVASSQRVNYAKSRILFLSSIDSALQNQICSVAGMALTEDMGSYLGVLIVHGQLRKNLFDPLLYKMDSAVAGWKTGLLSLAGHVTLVKSVIFVLPNHVMQSIPLPKFVYDEIDKKICGFIWSDQIGRRRVHMFSWDILTLPVDHGSLGIRSCREMNTAWLRLVGTSSRML